MRLALVHEEITQLLEIQISATDHRARCLPRAMLSPADRDRVTGSEHPWTIRVGYHPG